MKRALIFIVAYHAESTIVSVLRRIPKSIPDVEFEVLIIDDASSDGTFKASREIAHKAELPFPITVLQNPVNQRYGGNQKIGFLYAIEKKFDIVILLHGDGQYAPEAIPELIQPLVLGKADAVFGSRMIHSFNALKGGMPLYKFFANKFLTWFENTLLQTNLSEFHSGYRLYTTQALQRIPFELNTNEFHFDTEIIIQLVFAGLRIQEIPIPTYYGSEICRVNGVAYGLNVMRATIAARLQKYQILYRRNFDTDLKKSGEPNSHYNSKIKFPSTHSYVLEAITPGSLVVDIGCGPSDFQEAVRDKKCRIIGIDQYPVSHPELFEQVITTDLDLNPVPLSLDNADFILVLDLIEHLKSPERFAEKLHQAAQDNLDVKIIITTGNVAYFLIRFMLLLGQFNYGKKGILDLTHTRLFTFSSMARLLQQYGFQITRTRGVPAPFPLALGNGFWGHALLKINLWLITLSKGLFSYQIYMELKANPDLNTLLKRTLASLHPHEDEAKRS